MNIGALAAPGLLHQKQPDSPVKIEHAAKDFEALLINQMLQSAREAGGASLTGEDDNGENQENSTLLELSQQQFAQALSSRGGLGIANMVIAGLNQHADR